MRRVVSGGFTLALVSALAVAGASTGAQASQASGANNGVKPTPRPALARASAANLVHSKPAALHASKEDTFQAQPVFTGANGLQYVPYQRNYRGLPVIGGDFVVATDANGHVLSTSVAQGKATKLDSIKPQVKAPRAEAVASRQVAGAKLEKGTRLVVLQKGGSHLAWESTVDGTTKSGAEKGQPSRLSVYTDARSGKVLDTREHVSDGTGTGAYDGPNPLTIPTTKSGSTYSMTDPNNKISCQDAANNKTFTGSDDTWGNGKATDKETGCVDALFIEKTENAMLKDWDGRNGLDGNNGGWPIRIGLDDENAFYDGTQVQIGHNAAGDWIPTLDVLGHEQGHGVDDHTPGGISNGNTQEFVADTFGAATEWYANEPKGYDTPDFTVGEEINLVGSGPIRYMYDPSKAGDDNCYSSKVPGEEVHAAAGPGNHWFYLLAEGSKPTDGQPTSPTCNNSTVKGLGIKKAEQIMYNAMLLKTSSSSYLKYRTWTLTAAKNLYPGSCTEFNTVKAAWDAVSVPAQKKDPTCGSATKKGHGH